MSATDVEHALVAELGGAMSPDIAPDSVSFTGAGTLDSVFAVNELAAASIAAAGLSAARLVGAVSSTTPLVTIDRALACGWFGFALAPVGWELPSPWDALAGDYATADGWIRLHTNAPNHRAVALAVLGVHADRDAVGAAVAEWRGDDLEAAVISASGCAAVMRAAHEWAVHPQGRAVASEPVVSWDSTGPGAPSATWRPESGRPLAGLRVLDLTRVLAGPVATRFLAGLGADVLRIDPPDWDEPAIVPDTTVGKRSARVDAKTAEGLDMLRSLVASSDVVVHGYRSDALDKLGLSVAELAALRPGLVNVSLDAYGFTGPWRARRGFDSLVQMSCGIADAGMRAAGSLRPVPLPVQALDHATGYLAAAAVLEGIRRNIADGRGVVARLSLARTAAALERAGRRSGATHARDAEPATWRRTPLDTPWGAAALLPSPVRLDDRGLEFARSPRALGSDEPRWLP